jgi:hypothetical protein
VFFVFIFISLSMFCSAKLLVVFVVMTTLFVSCSKQESAQQTPVERGKYLVTLGGRHDCHTPKKSAPRIHAGTQGFGQLGNELSAVATVRVFAPPPTVSPCTTYAM